ncbi:RNA polymerase-associated protein CTR9 like [Dissostichus eleginoides]|uniref:RNA polymerase-associated protein CTR9 like n=1 Tax=Dissostichus eleginoides TaxID=100907 RepID=A0AAD9B198_DISEL|nr:RNA polymerase-associated protein CTR9 like [Dissostichus eleginoides]
MSSGMAPTDRRRHRQDRPEEAPTDRRRHRQTGGDSTDRPRRHRQTGGGTDRPAAVTTASLRKYQQGGVC